MSNDQPKSAGKWWPFVRVFHDCRKEHLDDGGGEDAAPEETEGTSISADFSAYFNEATQDWEASSHTGGHDWCDDCGEEIRSDERPLTYEEIEKVLTDHVGRFQTCTGCGVHEVPGLIDQGRCVRCHPAWAPINSHSIGFSVQPKLLPLYLDWIKGQMVKAKIAEATNASAA